MRDTKLWSAKYVELPGFEPLLQYLIGNATFEEAAMIIMEAIAGDIDHRLREMKDDLYELREEAEDKDKEISGMKTKINILRSKFAEDKDQAVAILKEFLDTI